jgi:hypothetical protein
LLADAVGVTVSWSMPFFHLYIFHDNIIVTGMSDRLTVAFFHSLMYGDLFIVVGAVLD